MYKYCTNKLLTIFAIFYLQNSSKLCTLCYTFIHILYVIYKQLLFRSWRYFWKLENYKAIFSVRKTLKFDSLVTRGVQKFSKLFSRTGRLETCIYANAQKWLSVKRPILTYSLYSKPAVISYHFPNYQSPFILALRCIANILVTLCLYSMQLTGFHLIKTLWCQWYRNHCKVSAVKQGNAMLAWMALLVGIFTAQQIKSYIYVYVLPENLRTTLAKAHLTFWNHSCCNFHGLASLFKVLLDNTIIMYFPNRLAWIVR